MDNEGKSVWRYLPTYCDLQWTRPFHNQEIGFGADPFALHWDGVTTPLLMAFASALRNSENMRVLHSIVDYLLDLHQKEKRELPSFDSVIAGSFRFL